MKTIGVVGGVGPLAGVDFQRKVVSQTKAERDQDHLDVLSVSFPGRIPDRTAYLLGDEPTNPAVPLAEQLALLEGAGAEIGAIPCNTAHAPRIFGEIQRILAERGARIALLNMIDEVMDFVAGALPQAAKVGVLCTLGTYRTRLYDDALAARGFAPLTPDEGGKREIHDAIYSKRHGVKSVGANPVAQARILQAIGHLKAKGAQAVVLGCTELPIVIEGRTAMGIPAIDPTLLLARAAIREAAPEKLAPYAERP